MACVANLDAFTTSAPAAGANTANAFGLTSFDASATAYRGWWCSNGLYKKVTGVTGGTTDGVLNTT